MTESAPIPIELRRAYELSKPTMLQIDGHTFASLIERIAQLEVTVSELRAINERLVLDVKRSTEENERLQAQIYHE